MLFANEFNLSRTMVSYKALQGSPNQPAKLSSNLTLRIAKSGASARARERVRRRASGMVRPSYYT